MTNKPLVSICIPAYKRVEFLKRLLESISIQSFKDFEVIITDDSPTNEVYELSQAYKDKFALFYFKNAVAVGTPANWNEAIRHAKGEWIKIMHDDDWFSSPESLEIFVEHIHNGCKLIFSGYTRIYETKTKPAEKMVWSSSYKKAIAKNPEILFANNLIGPPSVTFIHRSASETYDKKLKWRVDIDFYIRVLKQEGKYIYINKSLINVGMSETQVTQASINDPKVELPEGWIFLKKHGIKPLRNIWIYDAWWRLFRNMNIKTEKQLVSYVNENWPMVIVKMTKDIGRIPAVLVRGGITSKIFMGLSYLKNLSAID